MAEKLIDAAGELAARIVHENTERLHHTAAVVARARVLTVTVAPSAVENLIAAAWLHDIGYGSSVRESGFHPLEGLCTCVGKGGLSACVPRSLIIPVAGLSRAFSSSTIGCASSNSLRIRRRMR